MQDQPDTRLFIPSGRVQNQVVGLGGGPIGLVVLPDIAGAALIFLVDASLGLGPVEPFAAHHTLDAGRKRRDEWHMANTLLPAHNILRSMAEDAYIAGVRRLTHDLAGDVNKG